MCSKSRNEDKDNIDQDIDVCAIGVQTIMQSDHGTPRNQNKLKILQLILIPSVRESFQHSVGEAQMYSMRDWMQSLKT